MQSHDHEQHIFRQIALRGRVTDKDGVDDALEALRRVYRTARVHPRDVDRVVGSLRLHAESGPLHAQADKSRHVRTVSDDAKVGLTRWRR